MEATELVAFCAVAKFNSFSKASEHLGSRQPTVTAQVRRLEKELGTPLFDRGKRPVQLTPAGMKLAKLAMPWFDDMAGLMQRISDKGMVGMVRVASSAALTDHVMPNAIVSFLSEFPGSQVQMRAHVYAEIVHQVEAREVDLGVLPESTAKTGLEFSPLFDYRWMLIAPRGHPILQSVRPTPAEIARWPIIIRRPGAAINSWLALLEILRHQDLPYRVVLELDQMDSIKRYVGVGLGISILPEFAIEPSDLNTIGLRDMTHLLPQETAGMLLVKGQERPPLVQDFINTLRNATARRVRRQDVLEWL